MFMIDVNDPSAALAEARRRGVAVQGDETAGTFSAAGVQGRYKFQGSTVIVTVDKKPWYIPEALIEGQLRAAMALATR